MKRLLFILIAFQITSFSWATENTEPDFQWGNAHYFNINVGDIIYFQEAEVQLLELKNHFNKFRIKNDTVWIKVSRRSLPLVAYGLRMFVADNKNLKALSTNSNVHSLLQKDALICLSDFNIPMLNPNSYLFPISYNDGFLWSVEEDSHMFSYNFKMDEGYYTNGGMDIDLHDARGIEKHWILAMENSSVVWIEDKNLGVNEKEACLLLQSELNPDIYYLYEHLYDRKVEVKKGDKLVRGQAIGTIWGDEIWGHLHVSVIQSDTIPTFQNRGYNVVNYFPQFYELYFGQTYNYNKVFSKGVIHFAQSAEQNGNRKNLISFEEFAGKGWKLEEWNTTDRVEFVTTGKEGNARLKKSLFEGELASCRNPNNYYEYEINVRNGVYRIRANVGDLLLQSWQRIQFEGIDANTYSLDAGIFKWTSEKVVRVKDGKLTVRIFIDENNKYVAGINEIVFQQSY